MAKYLLFPGRHLVNTTFQEQYLHRTLLATSTHDLPDLLGEAPAGWFEDSKTIVFAVTSCNMQNSRYNPIPFHLRAIALDRFSKLFQDNLAVDSRIVGIPHYKPTARFAELMLKEILAQEVLDLDPDNTLVVSSTPSVIEAFRALGFAVLPAELKPDGTYKARLPHQVMEELADRRNFMWPFDIASATRNTLTTYRSALEHLKRLYNDPVLKESGSITENRNYDSYVHQMDSITDLKYAEVKGFLKPGVIVDDGCSDGGLLKRIARDFQDSDLYGVDLSAEMLHRASNAQRAGQFGEAFTFFRQRNLLDPTPPAEYEEVDTVICNSTLHEIYSYGNGLDSVQSYLREKFKQLRPGGRLVIRDVVGPNSDEDVMLWTSREDGLLEGPLDQLSTRTRFYKFMNDFKFGGTLMGAVEQERTLNGTRVHLLNLRLAMEFIMHMNYTDNWASEMQESYCFWGLNQWGEALEGAGFNVVHGSAYRSEWRMAHHFKDHVRLFSQGIIMRELEIPVTNMILVGEKPAE